MPADDESTPRTSKRATEEISAVDLLAQGLKELRKATERVEKQNTDQLVMLTEIKGEMRRGGDQFSNHHERISSLEKDRAKTIWAIIAALGSVAWSFIKDHVGAK